mmetsp:Transcript_12230/g.23111  ORF Transcript_12230/g.23111 Transcript_12230/m.23111 type:complete len:205 (+) Transcript_12230:848-1462(+)
MRAVQSFEAVITAGLIFALRTALFSTSASKSVSSLLNATRSRYSNLPRTIFGSGLGSVKMTGVTESLASRMQTCASSRTLHPSLSEALAISSSVSSFTTVTDITTLPLISASSRLIRASSSRIALSASSLACRLSSSIRWRSASSSALMAAMRAASRSSSSRRDLSSAAASSFISSAFASRASNSSWLARASPSISVSVFDAVG